MYYLVPHKRYFVAISLDILPCPLEQVKWNLRATAGRLRPDECRFFLSKPAVLFAPDEPDKQISGGYRSQSERQAYFRKFPELYMIALLSK